jgi:hypothetical protein
MTAPIYVVSYTLHDAELLSLRTTPVNLFPVIPSRYKAIPMQLVLDWTCGGIAIFSNLATGDLQVRDTFSGLSYIAGSSLGLLDKNSQSVQVVGANSTPKNVGTAAGAQGIFLINGATDYQGGDPDGNSNNLKVTLIYRKYDALNGLFV